MIAEFKKILAQFGLEYFNKYYGIYHGTVADVEDEEFLGRIKVKVPFIYGEDKVPNKWAWPKGNLAGKQIGFFAVPNVGDAVWVSFVGGDPRFPVWEHGWWATDEVPEEAKDEDRTSPSKMIWKSTSGHTIELDDLEEKELIRIKDKWGNEVLLNEEGMQLSTHEEATVNVVKMDEFGIKITSNEDEQTIFIDTENGLIHVEDVNGNIVELNSTGASIVSGAISFGTLDGSAEPAILGDTACEWLTDLCTALENVKVTTAAGPMPFLNLPEFIALKAKIDTLKSEIVTLD